MSEIPSISVVVAARDAEATLAAALDSLRAQTHGGWEAIVVDDGSTDNTARVACDLARRDPRIRLIVRPAAGVAAARNAGIAAAAHPWLLFLDADDLLRPGMLEAAARRLAYDPGLDIVEAAWAARLPAGEELLQPAPQGPDLFDRAVMFCPFAIHSVVVRKSLIEGLGGFDPHLRWGEDWDLWLRCGRAGARVDRVDDVGAIYNWRPASASTRIRRVLEDGLEVIRRAHRSDPRVADPVRRHADGAPASERPVAEYRHVAWTAGLAVAIGKDPAPGLDFLEAPHCPTLQPADIAEPLFYGVLRARVMVPEAWGGAWPALRQPIAAFLDAAEEASGAPDLAARARRTLARLVLEWSPSAPMDGLDGVHGCALELTARPEIDPPCGTSRIHARVTVRGRPIGSIVVPVTADAPPGELARNEAIRRLAWPLARVLFESRAGRNVGAGAGTDRVEGARIDGSHGEGGPFAGDGQASSPVVAVLGRLLPDTVARRLATGLLRRHKRGFEWLEREIVRRWLNRRALRPRRGPLSPEERARGELDLARGLPRRVPDGGEILVRFGAAPVGRIAVPSRTRARRSALRRTIIDELQDPLAAAFAAEAVGSAIDGAEPAQRPDGSLGDAVPLRRAGSGRLATASFVLQRALPSVRRALGDRAVASHLAILAYHQIAPDGRGRAAPYRLDPSEFEAQLALLRERGFYSIELEDWQGALRGRRVLRGRPVLITFDDGYRDVADTAWPLLRRYGFTATVFVVTERVGATSSWDGHLELEAPLLDWPSIRALERDGMRFGSHTATHVPLGAVSTAEVERELRGSLATLRARLDRPVPAIAYPYGDADDGVRLLAGRCGYRFGLTTRSEPASRYDDLLDLPRVEVLAPDSAAGLRRKLQLEDG